MHRKDAVMIAGKEVQKRLEFKSLDNVQIKCAIIRGWEKSSARRASPCKHKP